MNENESSHVDDSTVRVDDVDDDDDDDDDDGDVSLVHDASVAGDRDDDARGDRWTTGEDNDADARGARSDASLDAATPRTTPRADARG